MIGSVMSGGAAATNLGYRYGLPAAGVTLAGKALIDLTSAFGGAADQPEPNTLTMGLSLIHISEPTRPY